ncbi:MAG TPA: TetR/AcrR family transcriptional regulator [Hydrogenobaculum sp.]|nr:TetR/AcrR family transcriptional regulator [Hydrogenobaculum sp.]
MVDESVSKLEEEELNSKAKNRKKRKALETKLAIVEAGIKLFYEKGFTKTKISDITEKANVAHGTFYVYFKSKEDFFISILTMSRKELLENADEAIKLASEGKIEEAKKRFFIEGFSKMIQKSKLFGVLLFEGMCTDDRFKQFYKEGRFIFLDKMKKILNLCGIKEDYKAHMLLGLSKHLLEIYIFTGEDPRPIWQKTLKNLGVL